MRRNRMSGWSRAALLLAVGSGLVAGGIAAPASAAGPGAVQGKGPNAGHHAWHSSGHGKGTHRGWHQGRNQGRDHGQNHGRDRSFDYAALGDSYAAGYGGGALLDACGRTAEGYPALLDGLDGVALVSNQSCAGATALSTPPGPPEGPVDLPEQIEALAAGGLIGRGTDLVTLTIGGNDVRFGDVVAACAGPELPATCAPALEAAQAYAETTLAAQLQVSLARLRSLAPRAELVLTGYPHLFEEGAPGPLSPPAQALFNEGTDKLNAVLAAQLGRGSTFVDVVDEFAGHGVGSADPWIIFDGGPFDLHPNATGYQDGYLAAITADVDLPSWHGGCRGRS
ncbi:SGNH/GDSL hydrolase family protein [Arthrobacter sp. Sa2BUA2]|uniref:SGNH/GDSL hydrolase family protein n=1 Tax=Arthrobacter pullicola TaxID=2762224 RepID=A0ABR8YJT0_9MICC|nr:SGNH/GDSL hydrolase family protein [Arthrobacter pullicola]MBD8044467.1 SGNH/GDSL hydrolase family protein [Arthrobacter pullicola]